MSLMRRFSTVLLPIVGALALSACGINSVPTAQEEAKAKWADVQAQYQRRSNLVGNLVATVKAAGKQEQDTLVKVTEARAKATSVQVNAEDLSDPAKVAQFQAAQAQLSQGLGRLLASVEAYPDLKTNENYLNLQSQLEGTENRIAVAIRDYNGAVQAYNTRIRTFPDAIGAKIIHGAKPMTPFQATTPGAEEAPKVDFRQLIDKPVTVRSAILMGLMLLGGCGADAQAPKAAMELTGRVVDQANLIDDGLESQLTARLLRLERETGVQMVIATTPSLGGRTIKAYGLDLANAWGVGQAMVAPVERKVRIEVGYGLEAGMTNALCDEIIQRSIVPHFRTGDMPGGILTGTDAIISAIAKQRPAQRKAA